MHNPLPASLGSECKKATQILDSFINGSWRGSPGRELPERVLKNAKGLAILTVTKAGILGSLRFGSGILIARLPGTESQSPDGTTTTPGGWSPPSAISTLGLGFGGQAGFELTDFVFIFDSSSALEAFSNLGSLTLSGNFSIAFGPLGRNAEIAGGVSTSGGGSMRSFAKTKGLFGGVSLESGVLVERRWANRRFFGRRVTAGEILGGRIDVPTDADGREALEGLMRVLGEVFDNGHAERGGSEHMTDVQRGADAVPVPDPVPAPGPGPQESGTATRPEPEPEHQPEPNSEQAEDRIPNRDQTPPTEAEAEATANINARQAVPASASASASR
ncbi:uncharacterized protein BDV17DRAFT_285647 [Aspergillus undulatus]|uniref:uncharacterized protein n=1 Tax=Aspergillus undulatus TaxID=1810928 RepID=UPI003CCE40B9